MSKYLYKYVGPAFFDKVFASPNKVSLKCGYPMDFNDPYELFLTMDFGERPELVAFYADVVGKLPQLPTTCFSRSPAVLPMWAHYASNLQGFVLELDEDQLAECFPESSFGDVDYQDLPSNAVAENLARAYEIGKFRYMHFLQQSVFSAAYYTKQTCWTYEQERRMVVDEAEVVKRDSISLIEVPIGCVRSIICGPRASEEVLQALSKHADTIGSNFYELKVGKSSSTPYFVNTKQSYIFDGSELMLAPAYCAECKEPIKKDSESCSWCQIDESHKENAAARNSYRLLNHYGLLDSYLEGVTKIARDARKR
jgi:hypothetical protein